MEVTAASKSSPKLIAFSPPSIEEPFAPDIEGLEEARLRCRFMMNRIIQEVSCLELYCKLCPDQCTLFKIDNISIKPEIATDETRQAPYLSPFLFKMLLPLGVLLQAEASQVAQAVTASKMEPDALVNKLTSVTA